MPHNTTPDRATAAETLGALGVEPDAAEALLAETDNSGRTVGSPDAMVAWDQEMGTYTVAAMPEPEAG